MSACGGAEGCKGQMEMQWKRGSRLLIDRTRCFNPSFFCSQEQGRSSPTEVISSITNYCIITALHSES